MKIRVAKEVWSDSLGFLFYEEINGRKYIVKPIQLVTEEAKDGDTVEPTFRIPMRSEREFLKSMAEMAGSMGIQTDKQESKDRKYEGKLEATQYHLEDMRKLVFQKDEAEKSE